MSVARIYPFAENVEVGESCLSDWQSGQDKPSEDGHYLREFVEGEAISEFRDGQWLFDGFSPRTFRMRRGADCASRSISLKCR